MVQLNTILDSLVIACKQNNKLPSDVTYSTIVLDSGGDHSNVNPPVIEFSVESIERDTSRNTEKVGIETNENGREIGHIYTSWFDAVVNAEVLTVAGTKYNHRELEQLLRDALYQYDLHGMNHQLPRPDDTTQKLRDVSWISINSIQPDQDFSFSPSVRTRTLSLDVGFTHEVLTSEMGISFEEVDDVEIGVSVVFDDDEAPEVESYSTA